MSDHQAIFTRVYNNAEWGPGSGPGSAGPSMAPYIGVLDQVLQQLSPANVVDLGCGYFGPLAEVKWPGTYTGIDVVAAPIAANASFASEKRVFTCQDWLDQVPPDADLALCKDVLQHWPREAIKRGLMLLARFPFVLITNSVILGSKEVNRPVETGGCAPLNLMMPPWNLPVPPRERQWLWQAVDNPEYDLKLAFLIEGRALAAHFGTINP